MEQASSSDHLYDIAIIGMVGRFPHASTLEQFWQNLCDGVEAISVFNDEELLAAGVARELLDNPHYVKAGTTLDSAEWFDAAFFGYSPREAEIMDPQHRLFLECCWEVMEHAGYAAGHQGRVGVYAGSNLNTYLLFQMIGHRDLFEESGFHTRLSNDKDFLATRVSHQLNLHGPSIAVQTACSTSLVAVHLACQSLLNRECDMTLAGGVSLVVPQRAGYLYQTDMILSPDGHCRAFDSAAQGTVPGSGVGVVLLKRYDDALNDGDTIYAVIKGSAINNDGAQKVGYTATSVDGQTAVIAEAHAVAGVAPESISYVEAHGSGTALGDPIEVAALMAAFGLGSEYAGSCALGSVKTNIGHLDAAAGIAGLIKTTLALQHQQIPPSLHFERPNPHIAFEQGPFYVNTTLKPWPSSPARRRAGVSSFGMGGTNAHVVLEEAQQPIRSGPSRPWQVLLLSAKTETALENMTDHLAAHLRAHPEQSLADVAYTLQVGRKSFAHRRVVICQSGEDALEALERRAPQRLLGSQQETRERPIAFMFPGLGDHYPRMAAGLYESEAVFRDTVDRCCELLQPILGRDLRTVLYEDGPQKEQSGGLDFRRLVRGQPQDGSSQALNQTALAQPALFVIEYALAQLWLSWGVQPQALIGYSLGEYVAACVAEVFSLEDALHLVARRAQLIQSLPSGVMLAVSLPEREVRALLEGADQVALAAVNSETLCVVSGPVAAIADLEQQLHTQNIVCRRLLTSHAFHSPMMDPIVGAFLDLFATIQLQPPRIPYLSNVTGTWISDAEATDPQYWAAHLCQTVRFTEGVRELWSTPGRLLLEVGPGQTLSSFALQQRDDDTQTDVHAIPSLRPVYERQPDQAFLLAALGRLWLAGVQIDWSKFAAHEQRRRIPLPTYPFERQRYWIEATDNTLTRAAKPDTLAKRSDLDDWFYTPLWKQALPPAPLDLSTLPEPPGCWLLFSSETNISEALTEQLQRLGQTVITVTQAASFARLSATSFTIDPYQQTDYTALIDALLADGHYPAGVLHLWGLAAEDTGDVDFEHAQFAGFYSLIFLADAIRQFGPEQPINVRVIASGLCQIEHSDIVSPAKATVLGACVVIPQEYPQLRCAVLDLRPSAPPPAALLLADCLQSAPAPLVAYRAAQRWLHVVTPVPLPAATTPAPLFRPGGRYLITAAHTPLGQAVAAAVAAHGPCTLVLPYPPATPAEQISQAIQALARPGCTVLPQPVDLADPLQVQALRAHVAADGGPLHGLLYVPDRSGPPPFRLLAQTTPASAHPQLTASLHELRTLHDTFAADDLDLWHVHGSLATVLGGLGLATYTAAHAALAAYVQQQRQRGAAWSYIGWDVWQDARSSTTGLGATVASLAIRPDEGEAVSARLWHAPVGDILVATADLDTRIAQWSRSAQTTSAASPNRHTRPNLPTPYVAPADEIEERIALLWQEVLGVDQIGVHDNFFQLGGHSLLGTQLIARLGAAFQVDIPLRALMEGPTVAELALTIEAILIAEIEAIPEDTIVELN